MDLESIRARVSEPVTELVANPREYFRVQQVLRDRADLLAEVDRLRGISKRIRDMTDVDNPDSYRCDDREGCLDTVFAVAGEAFSVSADGDTK